MNSSTFHEQVRALMAGKVTDKKKLQAAEKAAFLFMAHFIDLPDAEAFGEVTVTGGTPNYDGAQTLTSHRNAEIDRITSAVFVGSSVQEPLEEWGIRRYQYHYRGQSSSARSGTPSAFTYYNKQFWLYKVPNISGTLYYTSQIVVTDILSFPDNYLPLMLELTKLHLAEPETPEGARAMTEAWRLARTLIKTFKTRMHPKKDIMELSTHRAKRVQALNEAI